MSRPLEELEQRGRQLHRPLNTFFRNRGFPPEEAEELTQETFSQALQSWGGFRGEAQLDTWLFGIATNLWRNRCRDSRRLKRTGEEIPVETLAAAGAEPAGKEPDPLDRLLGEEQARLVREAVAELPAEQREPLCLQLDQGLKYREIGDVLQVPADTVKGLLYKARQTLKTRLERQLGKGGY